jgi:hypothetical protein
MSISRYPRPGHRIAPQLLREVLGSELPDHRISQSLQLCDLDESAWARFNPATCKRLGAAVISAIPQQLPDFIQKRHFPRLPDEVTGDELLLEPRTRNCLASRGLLGRPQKLADLTVGEATKIPAFGKKCLVDLLTSLESFTGRARSVVEPTNTKPRQPDRRIRRAARKLQRLRGASLIRDDDPRFGHLIREMGLGAKSARQAADFLISGQAVPISPPLVGRCALDLSTESVQLAD